jgi:hypothetical protein
MELTEKRESLQPGLAAVFFVDNAMDIFDDRGAVACSLNLFYPGGDREPVGPGAPPRLTCKLRTRRR